VSFDSLARVYSSLEAVTFGSALQKARTYGLPHIGNSQRALVIGEGDGRFLAEVARSHPKLSVDCLDASAGMIARAQAQLKRVCPGDVPNIRFIHEDILTWTPTDSYDLLVTHFVLDCFPVESVTLIIGKLAQAARPNATWLLADFAIPPAGWRRVHAQIWLRAMYTFFGTTTAITTRRLVDPTQSLQQNGFVRNSGAFWRAGMLKSEIWRRVP
jgi:ubiquinone/menaquinone biosynthesis C-methylase UbiE